jgi:glycosyltransferase involved in cell wall biosynthesis
MIICHYGHNIGAQGGISSYVHRISQAQRMLGHEVHVLSCFSDFDINLIDQSIKIVREDQVYSAAEALGAEILHAHCTLRYPPNINIPIFRTLHGHSPYCPSGGKFMLRAEKPCDREYSLAGCLLGHFIGKCGSVRPHQIISNFHSTWTEMNIMKNVTAITVSHYLKERMVEAGYNPESIHVLHLTAPDNGQSTNSYSLDQARFLFLGRITKNKGLSWLLQAFKSLRHDAHLDIAGEGPQLDSMMTLADELGLTGKVTFHGWVSGEKVKNLMQESTALVIPSLWHEPGGTVAFEAMMSSRAVISSAVGGMPEVIRHEINGLLVEPNDVKGLAQSLDRLCLNSQEAKDLGEAGYNIMINEFNIHKHIEELDRIYKSS